MCRARICSPFLALGKLLNRQRIHWLDEVNLGRRQDAEVFCFSRGMRLSGPSCFPQFNEEA